MGVMIPNDDFENINVLRELELFRNELYNKKNNKVDKSITGSINPPVLHCLLAALVG